MVSAAIPWYGVTKPFFVNSNGIKVNKENYCRHFSKEMLPVIEKVVTRHDWIFARDVALSHRSNLAEYFLIRKLKLPFICAK